MGAGITGTDDDNPAQFEDIIFEYAGLKKKKNNRAYRVKFSAFVTNFQDNYTQTWNSTSVYGKPDAIETYQNTRRVITLGWDVPSNGPREGYGNMMKLEALIKMLYPVYENVADVSTIQSPPLLRLRFANLIKNMVNPRGLLGHTQGFTFAPDLNAGFYNTMHPSQAPGLIFPKKHKGLIPKTYNMSCQYIVLHEHDLGFDSKGDFRTTSAGTSANEEAAFPYGFWVNKSDLARANKLNKSHGSKGTVAKTPDEAKAKVAQVGAAGALKPQAGKK
tara:strand:- start:13260 stop:14084 length:825 start_codon:yes stop_codon:yes gene_type:complete